MNRRRKQKVLVTLEERQLALKSEAIKQYPRIEQLLQNYESIYETDFEDTNDFAPEEQTFLLYAFKDLISEASKEWCAVGNYDEEISPNPQNWKKCSLCRRPNKYIYYIKDKLNNNQLNVGSDCINKFPDMQDGHGYAIISKLKRKRIQEYKRIERINKFNTKFPGTEDMIRVWQQNYDKLPIVMPEYIHTSVVDVIKSAKEIYDGYIKGKYNTDAFKEFEKLVRQYEMLSLESKKYVDENVNKRFVCTKEIKEWLLKKNSEKLLERIVHDGGYYTRETIKFICEANFFHTYLGDFKAMLKSGHWFIDHVKDPVIVFRYKVRDWQQNLFFECSIKSFMSNFGHYLFDPGRVIDEKDILTSVELVWSISNVGNYTDILNQALEKTSYYLSLRSNFEDLEINDKSNKRFAVVKAKTFCEAQKGTLLKDKDSTRELLTRLFDSQITNWRPFADKEKYDIGNISENPAKRSLRDDEDEDLGENKTISMSSKL